MSIEEEKALSDIRERIVRVETKLDDLIEDLRAAVEARDIARDAMQYAKSAHRRLDRIDKVIFWAATTIIGAIIVGAISLLYKTQGG